MQILQFFLKASDTEYYIVNGEQVSLTSEPYSFPHACMNWTELQVSFNRNVKYWGVFREFSNQLTLTKEAARVARYVRYTQGVDGTCILLLRVLNTGNLTYEDFVSANLDFSQFVDERDFVQINMMEGGLSEALKAQESVSQEISLVQPEALTVLLDGVFIGFKASWQAGRYSSVSGDLYTSSVSWVTTDAGIGGFALYLAMGDNSQIYQFVRMHSQRGFSGNALALLAAHISGTPSSEDGDYIFYTNSLLRNVSVSGNVAFSFRTPNQSGLKTVRIRAIIVDQTLPSPSVLSSVLLYSTSTSLVDTEVGVIASLSGNIPVVPAGCYVMIVASFQKASGSSENLPAYFPIEGSSFHVNFQGNVPKTTTKALRYFHYANRMAQKLGANGVNSNFLTNTITSNAARALNMGNSAWNTLVFSGDAARQNPTAVIKSDFEEMAHDGFSRWALGVGIEENNFRIEPIPYFLQDVEIFRIEEHVNFKSTPNKDYIFNDILTGYEPQDTDNVVGKNEYNTTSEWLLESIKRVPKQDDAKTAYIAGVYAIEQGRAETLDQTKQDNKFDNKTMVIEVDPLPVASQFKPFRPVGQVITGVDDPAGVYNVYISPASEFVRHMGRIKSFCETGFARFKTTDKNPELVSTFVNGTLVEKADRSLVENTHQNYDVSRWFQDNNYELDCKSGIALYNAIKNNPYGYITVVENGKEYRGHVLESIFNIAKENPNTLKLLTHKNDDLTSLIR